MDQLQPTPVPKWLWGHRYLGVHTKASKLPGTMALVWGSRKHPGFFHCQVVLGDYANSTNRPVKPTIDPGDGEGAIDIIAHNLALMAFDVEGAHWTDTLELPHDNAGLVSLPTEEK